MIFNFLNPKECRVFWLIITIGWLDWLIWILGIKIAFFTYYKVNCTKIRWEVGQYRHSCFKKFENSIYDLDIKYPNGSSCKKDWEGSVTMEVGELDFYFLISFNLRSLWTPSYDYPFLGKSYWILWSLFPWVFMGFFVSFF